LTTPGEKKTDVSEYPEAFEHVGLLVNKPPGPAGLPFAQSSDDCDSTGCRCGPKDHRRSAAGFIVPLGASATTRPDS